MSELNGDRPGVSLFEIVSELCAWNVLPRVEKGRCGITLQFDGGSGDELVATYTATLLYAPANPFLPTRLAPTKEHLVLTWKETATENFQIICRTNQGNALNTLVQAYVRRGNNSFPVWGDPHPRVFSPTNDGDINGELRFRSAQGKGNFLAARMYLAMGVDWQKEIFRGPPVNISQMTERFSTFFGFGEKNW